MAFLNYNFDGDILLQSSVSVIDFRNFSVKVGMLETS